MAKNTTSVTTLNGKSALERSDGIGYLPELRTFLEENGDKEITPEIFKQFKIICDKHPDKQKTSSGLSLPLEIIDPDSGWFSVLIINKQTTLRKFISAAHSNMNQWFVL